ADHGFREWLADAQFLLRERHGGRTLPAHAFRRALPGEPRQPARNDDPRICGKHQAADGFAVAHRVPATARGRSAAALPRHHKGARRSRLGTASDARRGAAIDGGVFSPRRNVETTLDTAGLTACATTPVLLPWRARRHSRRPPHLQWRGRWT